MPVTLPAINISVLLAEHDKLMSAINAVLLAQPEMMTERAARLRHRQQAFEVAIKNLTRDNDGLPIFLPDQIA